jgi:hypothetical protein
MFKKGKSRTKEKKEHTVSKSLTKWAVTLVVGLVVWVGLTAAQAYVLTDKDISPAVYALKDIEEGTIISSKNVKDYFGIESVNSALITTTTYTSLDDITGRLITPVSKGEILSSTKVKDSSTINSNIKDPVEVSFAVSRADSAVNGYIRAGDVVDLYIAEGTEEDTIHKTNKLLLSNVYIVASYDSSYLEIQSNDTTSTALYFVIEMERDDVAKFYDAAGDNDVTMVRVKND